MLNRTFLSTLMAGLVMSNCFAVSLAQDVLPQLEEARAFFNQAAKNTGNPYIASLAKENLRRLEATSNPKMKVEVPVITGHDALSVPALLNNRVMGTFVIDTGATHTVITPRIAKKLGVVITEATPTVSVLTANGRVKAPIVTVPELAIGQVRVRNVQVIVQDLGSDLLLSGLLGMNFFKNMNMQIRSDRLILEVDAQEISSAY